MTLRQFIRENRAELDAAILGSIHQYDGNGGRGTVPANARVKGGDTERRTWILNDEGLYLWARREGVRI